LVTLIPPATEPSLVLAWRWYGDANRAAELVARNALRHPGFVPARAPLQVVCAAG
jgi:prophage DNA circulation protein